MDDEESEFRADWFALRDSFGSFRLAFLETLLRAADCCASKQVQKQQNP